MTPKIDISQYMSLPSEATLASYPTLIDVMEAIAVEEENTLISQLVRPFSRTFTPDWLYYMTTIGHCQLVQSNGMPVLMPMGRRFGVYYRGESKFHQECLPSLWREKNKEKQLKDQLLSYLQTSEMIAVMEQHPVIRFLTHNPIRIPLTRGITQVVVPIQYDGLAQHYGIKTRYLDLTTDKWSAAFFAATDYKNGNYIPHTIQDSDSFENKFGAIYILQQPIDQDILANYNIFPIGQQYFNRPGCQSALVMDMNKFRDLNLCPIVKKVFFRHENQVSEQIFFLSQRGKRFFPNDSLQKVVEKIVGNSAMEFSTQALEWMRKIYYPKLSIADVRTMVQDMGCKIVAEPVVAFDAEDVKRDKEIWDKGGSQRYLDSIHVMDLIPIPNHNNR